MRLFRTQKCLNNFWIHQVTRLHKKQEIEISSKFLSNKLVFKRTNSIKNTILYKLSQFTLANKHTSAVPASLPLQKNTPPQYLPKYRLQTYQEVLLLQFIYFVFLCQIRPTTFSPFSNLFIFSSSLIQFISIIFSPITTPHLSHNPSPQLLTSLLFLSYIKFNYCARPQS